ncbi:PREDICTED: ribonuclease H At1g65750 [Prunus dulcis]|uniref:PREDICTED: ribonuclease H At1g65750 n=1 Tax=Prunus dulcis TaxID=3755 RepID=A0A5E4G0B6_PRUDU|nr:PREDICTED: ribonuclease H At1g65750 [Prunus dulcis]
MLKASRLVQIYGDAWIPYRRIFTAQTAPRVPMNTKVSTLISASGRWDVPKNLALYYGRYAVKSGYWAALEYQNFALSHTSISTGSSSSQKLWKHIWKMKVPAKIQHFLWRFALNGISTKAVLFHRKIAMDVTCFCCSTSCETAIHALRDCPAIRPVM